MTGMGGHDEAHDAASLLPDTGLMWVLVFPICGTGPITVTMQGTMLSSACSLQHSLALHTSASSKAS